VEFRLTIHSWELSKEEVRLLLQSIRDCEQGSFPDKKIAIVIEVPELSEKECAEILTSIKPAFALGPVILHKHNFDRGERPGDSSH